MDRILAAKRFRDASDRHFVASLYRTFFVELCLGSTSLHLEHDGKGCGWGVADMELLGQAAPAFSRCCSLSLRDHHALDDDAVQRLTTEVLPDMPHLETLDLRGCGFTESGLERIMQALPSMGALKHLSLPRRLQTTATGAILSQQRDASDVQITWSDEESDGDDGSESRLEDQRVPISGASSSQ